MPTSIRVHDTTMQVGSIIRPVQEKKAAWSWYDSSHISFHVHHHAVIQLLYVHEVRSRFFRTASPSLGYAAQVLAVELGGKKLLEILLLVSFLCHRFLFVRYMFGTALAPRLCLNRGAKVIRLFVGLVWNCWNFQHFQCFFFCEGCFSMVFAMVFTLAWWTLCPDATMHRDASLLYI